MHEMPEISVSQRIKQTEIAVSRGEEHRAALRHAGLFGHRPQKSKFKSKHVATSNRRPSLSVRRLLVPIALDRIQSFSCNCTLLVSLAPSRPRPGFRSSCLCSMSSTFRTRCPRIPPSPFASSISHPSSSTARRRAPPPRPVRHFSGILNLLCFVMNCFFFV